MNSTRPGARAVTVGGWPKLCWNRTERREAAMGGGRIAEMAGKTPGHQPEKRQDPPGRRLPRETNQHTPALRATPLHRGELRLRRFGSPLSRGVAAGRGVLRAPPPP